MAEFTVSEQAYITRFNQTKASLSDAYSSIKHIDITDKDSLMKTLLYFNTSYYSSSSIVYIASELLRKLPGILRVKTLKNTNYAINLTNKTANDKEQIIDSLFQQLMSYLPDISIPVSTFHPDTSSRESFLKDLTINRQLLLTGPPNANEHTIDTEKAAIWVSKQKTAERQRLAQILLKHIRYISHSELLHALKICVQKAKEQLVQGPVTFIVGYPQKSNYYISLLFTHFWLEEGLPIDNVIENFNTMYDIGLVGNYLDIDDMTYSGSQTETILTRNFKIYCNNLRDSLKEIFGSNEAYKKTHMFLPRYIVEKTLHQSGFHYILVRAFMSEYSLQRLSVDNSYAPRFPYQIVTSEVIPYMPSVDPIDRKKIEYLFNNPVYSTVYFDHKVADMASTFLLPIATGIVPERMMYLNQGQTINTSLVNNIKGDGVEFYPFLQHCSTDRELPRNRANIWRTDMAERYRCPPAWYKQINYAKGTYSKTKGGTRKKKRSSKGKSRSIFQ